MIKTDEENLVLVESANSVDELNAEFYGRFPFPWRPARFDYLVDPNFETVFLNQNIADWKHRTVPRNLKIWIAGCGTNQAIFTALRFPTATILGSDLSLESLDLCAKTTQELGIMNLELRQESLNHVTYANEFDYVICTGVIHHNADPPFVLTKLANALKPTGILELMVYNRFHRIITSAFQKAVRTIRENAPAIDFEAELSIVKKLITQFPVENSVSNFLRDYKDSPEPAIADTLMQPVEHSYTVESVSDMATTSRLELVAPCVNIFDKATKTFSWNMRFRDSDLQDSYDALPDLRRWQVSNLLLFEKAPMLWFFLQRKDCGRKIKSEMEVCEEFLETRFVRSNTTQRSYVMENDGTYRLSPNSIPFPALPGDGLLRNILDSTDAELTMRDIFQKLEIDPTFHIVNDLRIKLTTSAFPYLKAVNDFQNERFQKQEANERIRELKEASLKKFRERKNRS